MQLLLGNLPDIHAVYGDPSLCHVVEPGNQVDQRGFSAAGAADDRCGLARFRCEADVFQRILIRAFIPEGNVLKTKLTLRIFQLLIPDGGRVMDGQGRIQHLLNPVCRNACTGQHDGDHGDHQEGHDDLHGIGDEGDHVAHLHGSGIDPVSAEPDDHHSDTVHDQHHGRHHDIHDPVGEQLGFHQVLIGRIKPVFLVFFPVEGTDDGKPGQDFPRHQVQAVHQRLHLLKFGHCYSEKRHHQHKNRHHSHNDDPAEPGPGSRHSDDAANADDRRIEHHTKQHDLHHLYLLNVVGASGDQGRDGEFVQLIVGEREHPGEHLSSQLHTDLCRCPGRQQAGQHSCGNHQEGETQHLCTGAQKVVHLYLPQVHSQRFIFCLDEQNRPLADDGITHISHTIKRLLPDSVDGILCQSAVQHCLGEAGHIHPGFLQRA